MAIVAQQFLQALNVAQLNNVPSSAASVLIGTSWVFYDPITLQNAVPGFNLLPVAQQYSILLSGGPGVYLVVPGINNGQVAAPTTVSPNDISSFGGPLILGPGTTPDATPPSPATTQPASPPVTSPTPTSPFIPATPATPNFPTPTTPTPPFQNPVTIAPSGPTPTTPTPPFQNPVTIVGGTPVVTTPPTQPVITPPSVPVSAIDLSTIIAISSNVFTKNYIKDSMTPLTDDSITFKNIDTVITVQIGLQGIQGVAFDPPGFSLSPGQTQIVDISYDTAQINQLPEGTSTITCIINESSNTVVQSFTPPPPPPPMTASTPPLVASLGQWLREQFAGSPEDMSEAQIFSNPPISVSLQAMINEQGTITPKTTTRWTKQDIFQTGNYGVQVSAQDGMKVLIDGQTVLNAWRVQSVTSYAVTSSLSGGQHTVQVFQYSDVQVGTAVFNMNLLPVQAPIPIQIISPPPQPRVVPPPVDTNPSIPIPPVTIAPPDNSQPIIPVPPPPAFQPPPDSTVPPVLVPPPTPFLEPVIPAPGTGDIPRSTDPNGDPVPINQIISM